jgi:hypothetical protein
MNERSFIVKSDCVPESARCRVAHASRVLVLASRQSELLYGYPVSRNSSVHRVSRKNFSCVSSFGDSAQPDSLATARFPPYRGMARLLASRKNECVLAPFPSSFGETPSPARETRALPGSLRSPESDLLTIERWTLGVERWTFESATTQRAN